MKICRDRSLGRRLWTAARMMDGVEKRGAYVLEESSSSTVMYIESDMRRRIGSMASLVQSVLPPPRARAMWCRERALLQ